ncbi:MAG: guanylate kinase [Rhodocyclaceae bacterium]|nr:guanylate kinase [Rhodocyclaceae bacterium]
MSGNLFIVSAPSGAGKTTLVRGLLQEDPLVHLSISYTTRAPRQGEMDGREYHFVDTATFGLMKERGDFLEWAEVHGNFYGTSRVWIEDQIAQGRDILLEIDWQGAHQVRKAFPSAIGIFILPPSLAELESRLTGRGTDRPEVIARRLGAAQEEMSHVDEFEYAIINKELREALADLCAVVRAARLPTPSQRVRHSSVFADLTAGQA